MGVNLFQAKTLLLFLYYLPSVKNGLVSIDINNLFHKTFIISRNNPIFAIINRYSDEIIL